MKNSTFLQFGSDLHEKNDVGMYYCGKRVDAEHHSYGPEIRNYYMFVLVNKGEATFFHKNGEILLKPHDLLVMCPGEKIHYVAKTSWSIQWVGLYGQTVEQYMDLLSINGENPIVHIQQYYEMEKILNELYDSTGERYEYAKCIQISLIYQFFSILLRNSNQKLCVDMADSAKKIIDYNFDKYITIKDIADSLYVSHEHLTRQFAGRYGLSPKEYLINKRMDLAKKLLSDNDTSITEISNSVGYKDQFYFCRIFKKLTGLSPTDYRKTKTEKLK